MHASRRSILLAGLHLAVWNGSVRAQVYPSSPIRIVVPVSAGSGTDGTARFVAAALSKAWNVSVIVDNKPGAAGALGTEIVARSRADGYTLLLAYASHYSNPWSMSLSFDPVEDFVPLARLANTALILATRSDSPLRSVRDVIAAAKAKPGALSYGTAGIGSTSHVAGALFEQMAAVKFNHVPYKNASQVPIDASTGQVDIMFGGTASALPLIRSGRLRALAVTTERRSANLPDVPTVAEEGLAGFESSSPIWMFAPRGILEPVVNRLSEALVRIASTPEFAEFCLGAGIEVDVRDAATSRAEAEAELAKWKRLVELTRGQSN